ncbi:TonB-dependent receptor [Woodsholea maritima]|uniref:TonB-dependent receptor n=1 Tax=Woodsholea maritima TaxID=240237 RepID=UPI00036A7212|nr:TonB-dependent receptor [Woodsholea maritima]
MAFFKKLAYGASAAALVAVAAPAALYAQTTSAQLRGSVVDASGQPISNASVTIIHVPTGTASVTVTGTSGQFFQSGLRVGGPYTVTVAAAGFSGDALTDLNLRPGAQSPLQFTLNTADTEVIVVRGEAINTLDLNNGVGSNFSANDIANQPAGRRDVIATLARDPLASSFGEGNLSVAGVNPRFNGLAIDGALQQDDLGLSSGTYATSRSPINLDAVESASLVATDYSVTASGFTGGLVNLVTKSGTNEFDGSLFYYYQDENYFGENAFDKNIDKPAFDEKEYGITLGGPIIKDRLFFFGSYDKYENTGVGSNFLSKDEENKVDTALFAALNTLVRDSLNYDMGGRPNTAANPETSERWLGKLDWNINDDHRASFTYQRAEETGSSASATSFTSSWYDLPVKLDAYTLQVFSNWTPNLSTTFRANLKKFDRGQNCRAGDVGALEFKLKAADVAGTVLDGLITAGDDITLYGGCDRYRHANDYNDERLQIFASADYTWGDHVFTVGGEYEKFDLYNLFLERSKGVFIFDTVAQIESGTANQVLYRNSTTNVASDAASDWGFKKFTLFAQDTWQVRHDLELNLGLRYERYDQSDAPAGNEAIGNVYGLDTRANLDGIDLIMPRASFRYTPFDRTTITGGFGLFAGGDPKVWTSNAFATPYVDASLKNVANVDVNVIPQALIDSVSNGTPIITDVIAEDFEMPSDWKASIRLDQEFDINFGGFDLGDDYLFTVQYLYTKTKNGFTWNNLAQTELAATSTLGVAPDGRPIYADLDAQRINNLTELSNYSGGEGHVYSVSLAKTYDYGFGFNVSYAHQDVESRTPGSSSRGISNWRSLIGVDRNNPHLGRAPYEVEHSFKIALSYEREFITDLTSRFDLFGEITSGEPFSYTFGVDRSSPMFGRAGNGESPYANDLLYVPTANDPSVVFGQVVDRQGVVTPFDKDGFFDYVAEHGLKQGGIFERNGATSAWNQRWDFRFQQELPGIWGAERFVGDNRLKFVLDIKNVANLLNDDWGTMYNGQGYDTIALVSADLVSAADVEANGAINAAALDARQTVQVNGRDTVVYDASQDPRLVCQAAGDCLYRFNGFNGGKPSSQDDDNSVYSIRVGLRYEF